MFQHVEAKAKQNQAPMIDTTLKPMTPTTCFACHSTCYASTAAAAIAHM